MDFFVKDTATTEIYTLSLHDDLPICNTLSDRDSYQSKRSTVSTLKGNW